MQHSVRHTIRVTAIVCAVLFAGTALAEQKQKSDEEIADCESRAAGQFGLDTGNCGSYYPSYSDAYSVCMMNAVTKYTNAYNKCNETSSAALSTLGTSSGDDDSSGGGNGGGSNHNKPKGTKATGGKSGGSSGGGKTKPPHETPKPPVIIY